MKEQNPQAHHEPYQWQPLTQPRPASFGAIRFGELAEMWWKDYVDNPKVRLAEPTRLKYRTRLRSHILPRWKDVPISQMRRESKVYRRAMLILRSRSRKRRSPRNAS